MSDDEDDYCDDDDYYYVDEGPVTQVVRTLAKNYIIGVIRGHWLKQMHRTS